MLSIAVDAWERFWEQRKINMLAGISENLADLFRLPTWEELDEEKALLLNLDEEIKITGLHFMGCDFSTSTTVTDLENPVNRIYYHIIKGWQKCLANLAVHHPHDFIMPYGVTRKIWQLSNHPVPSSEFISYALRPDHFHHRNKGGLVAGGSGFYSYLKVALTEAIAFTNTEMYPTNPVPVTTTLICDGDLREYFTDYSEVKPLLETARQKNIRVIIRGFVPMTALQNLRSFQKEMQFTEDELLLNYYGHHGDKPDIGQTLHGHVQMSDSIREAAGNAFKGISCGTLRHQSE